MAHVPVEEESHLVISALDGTHCIVETIHQRLVEGFVFVVTKSAQSAVNLFDPLALDLLRFRLILLDEDR